MTTYKIASCNNVFKFWRTCGYFREKESVTLTFVLNWCLFYKHQNFKIEFNDWYI